MLKSLTSETRKMMTPPLMIGTGAAMALGSPALLTLAGAYAVNSYAWRMAMAGPYMALRTGRTGAAEAPGATATGAAPTNLEAIAAYRDASKKTAKKAPEKAPEKAATKRPEMPAGQAANGAAGIAELADAPADVEAPAKTGATSGQPAPVEDAKKTAAKTTAAPETAGADIAPPATGAATKAATAAGTAAGKAAGAEAAETATAPATETAADPAAPAAPATGTSTIGPTAPAALDAPRNGGADDLTAIKGIGPKLAEKLGEMGIYHYDQIAKWSAAEVAFMDENLGRPTGRPSRDGWVSSAAALVRR